MGQLVAPQNTAVIPKRPAEGLGQAQQRSDHRAKGGTSEEHWHDLAAAEAGPQSEGGKDQLEQERLRDGLARQHPADDSIPGAVVGLFPHQQGQQQHQGAANSRPDQGIGEVFGIELGAACITLQNRMESRAHSTPITHTWAMDQGPRTATFPMR